MRRRWLVRFLAMVFQGYSRSCRCFQHCFASSIIIGGSTAIRVSFSPKVSASFIFSFESSVEVRISYGDGNPASSTNLYWLEL